MRICLKGYIKSDQTIHVLGKEFTETGAVLPYVKTYSLARLIIENSNKSMEFGRVLISVRTSTKTQEYVFDNLTISSGLIVGEIGKTLSAAIIKITMYDVNPTEDELQELMMHTISGTFTS